MNKKHTIATFNFVSFLIVFLLWTLVPKQTRAQVSVESIPDKLKSGLEQGNAHEISNFFHESLTFELLNQAGVFSKIQAEKLLLEFFQKNKVDSISIQRNGKTGSADNIFTICELVCGTIHYRVYFVRSKKIEDYLIHSLSITKI